MPFLLAFLCRNSSSTNYTSSNFFLWVTNHDCISSKLSLLLVVQYKLPWLPECFHPCREIPPRKGKYPMLRKDTKPRQLIKHANLFHSLTCILQIFVPNLLKWSKPRYLKAEVLRVLQKVRNVLVRYLLSGICILGYSCTGCNTSKIYLCREDNSSQFV